MTGMIEVRIFYGIPNNLKIRDSSRVSRPRISSGNCYGSKNSAWALDGGEGEVGGGGVGGWLNVGPAIFFGFDFCPHTIIPVT